MKPKVSRMRRQLQEPAGSFLCRSIPLNRPLALAHKAGSPASRPPRLTWMAGSNRVAAQCASPSAAVMRSSARVADWRSLSRTRQYALRTEILTQRVRVDNLAANRPEQGRENELLALLLPQRAMDERLELAAVRPEKQVSRWLHDLTGTGNPISKSAWPGSSTTPRAWRHESGSGDCLWSSLPLKWMAVRPWSSTASPSAKASASWLSSSSATTGSNGARKRQVRR